MIFSFKRKRLHWNDKDAFENSVNNKEDARGLAFTLESCRMSGLPGILFPYSPLTFLTINGITGPQ